MAVFDIIHIFIYNFYKKFLRTNDTPLGYSVGILSACITLNIFTVDILVGEVYPMPFDVSTKNSIILYFSLCVFFLFRYFNRKKIAKDIDRYSEGKIYKIVVLLYVIFSFLGAYSCFIFLRNE